MELTVKIDYKGLAEAFNAFPVSTAREIRVEMKKATRALARHAKLHHRFKAKSGNLERSIQEEVDPTGLSGKVFLNTGVAKYGPWVHDGTDPHIIRPKNKAALAFVMGGKTVLVPKKSILYGEGGYLREYWRELKKAGITVSKKGYVNHPGTRPDEFLYAAAEAQKPFFIARINAAINRVIQKFGKK